MTDNRHSRGALRWLPRIFSLGFLAVTAALRADDLSAHVVILANSDEPDSLRIARHYAEVREVPAENIVALPMPTVETIGWPEFLRTIWEPLESELVRRKWIDAVAMTEKDAIGRTKYAVSGHSISYLVVCRGVPLRVMHDPKLYTPVVPMTNLQIFRTNAGAVDSELGLLAYQVSPVNPAAPDPNYPINAFIPNPLFGNDHPTFFDATQVIKVSRLDGPTVEDAMALVDRAVAAEREGVMGRAYIDLGGKDPAGDRWLSAAGAQLEELGFDTDVDRAGGTIPATARFDAPVLYFGWYSSAVTGPFLLPGFQFPPGAIALHIYSFSADTLHAAEPHWSGFFVAHGVTATVGNVFEPYLQFTHRPDFMVRALVRGETFGDAACYALPALSWQAIAIGDPLYRPFTVPLETQLKNRKQLPTRLAGYAVVRRMNVLDARHRADEALALARSVQRDEPSLAVAMALARRLKQAGDKPGAAAALGFVPLLKAFRPDEWGLAHEAALLLAACDRPVDAMHTLQNLFRIKSVPRGLRLAWLPEAQKIAAAAQDLKQGKEWSLEQTRLSAETETTK